jgi:hypothetical protein
MALWRALDGNPCSSLDPMISLRRLFGDLIFDTSKAIWQTGSGWPFWFAIMIAFCFFALMLS